MAKNSIRQTRLVFLTTTDKSGNKSNLIFITLVNLLYYISNNFILVSMIQKDSVCGMMVDVEKHSSESNWTENVSMFCSL